MKYSFIIMLIIMSITLASESKEKDHADNKKQESQEIIDANREPGYQQDLQNSLYALDSGFPDRFRDPLNYKPTEVDLKRREIIPHDSRLKLFYFARIPLTNSAAMYESTYTPRNYEEQENENLYDDFSDYFFLRARKKFGPYITYNEQNEIKKEIKILMEDCNNLEGTPLSKQVIGLAGGSPQTINHAHVLLKS